MTTQITLNYDPKSVEAGFRRAAEAIRNAAKDANAFGGSAIKAAGDVYRLSESTYKLADAGSLAKKETFSLRATIDEMVRTAPEGIRKMREEMARFKEEARLAKAEAWNARSFDGGRGVGSGSGGTPNARGGYSGGAVAGAGAGGAAAGAAISAAVSRGLGLDALGIAGEAAKDMLPTFTRLAPALIKTSVAGYAVYKTVESAVSIWGNWNKTIHDTVNEMETIAPRVLSLGEALGFFAANTRAGLADAAKEVERWNKARITGTRSFDADEKRMMDIENRTEAMNSPEGRAKAAWLKQNTILEGRWQAEQKRASQRSELARKTEEKMLLYAKIRDQGLEKLEQSRARREQRESDDRVRRAQQEADRIQKASQLRDAAQGVLGETGGLGDIVRGAVSGADPKAVEKAKRQRRNMLTNDAAEYNRYLRNEENEKARKEIDERFSGAGGTGNTVADRQKAYQMAWASSARRERERNRESRRDIGREMRSPAETARAQGDVAQAVISTAASQSGASAATQQLLVAAVNALQQQDVRLQQEEASSRRLQQRVDAMMNKTRAKAQRTGRN